MIILYLLVILIIMYILLKLILFIIVKKHGKFTYDGFNALGFSYVSRNDIFYSTKNAWQKNFGYSYIYDVLAPIFRMIIDTESIKFNYNNKNWLIVFWKGQYGIVTGSEIGVYCTKEKKVDKKTIYFPANDSEMLNIYFALYKNRKLIQTVHATHWWLTIFKLGMFSKPKELSMDINITFPNYKMLNAFLISFKKLGYTYKDFIVIENTFYFRYKKPKTRKVWTRMYILDSIRQFFNRKNVDLYNKFLIDYIDNNKTNNLNLDNKKVIVINDLLPNFFKNKEDSDKIKNSILNEKTNNIILLNTDIYPRIRRNNHE